MNQNNKKVIVIGTGALGGYYGVKLAKSGVDVHFLLRGDFDHVKEKGLVIRSKRGDIIIDKPKCYNNSAHMPKGDIILVALKTTSNNELKNLLPPVLQKSSIILLLQNGLHNEDYIIDLIDNKQIYGGLSFLASSKDAPGVITHHDFGTIKLGQWNRENKPIHSSIEIIELADLFNNAGVPATITPDLYQAQWEKLAWNIPFAGLSVVLDADTRKIVSNPSSLELAKQILKDVGFAAAACGKNISEEYQQKMIDLTASMVPYLPSMKLDFDKGRPLETESVFGNPLRAAQKAGYDAPWISMLYNLINHMEKSRKTISGQ